MDDNHASSSDYFHPRPTDHHDANSTPNCTMSSTSSTDRRLSVDYNKVMGYEPSSSSTNNRIGCTSTAFINNNNSNDPIGHGHQQTPSRIPIAPSRPLSSRAAAPPTALYIHTELPLSRPHPPLTPTPTPTPPSSTSAAFGPYTAFEFNYMAAASPPTPVQPTRLSLDDPGSSPVASPQPHVPPPPQDPPASPKHDTSLATNEPRAMVCAPSCASPSRSQPLERDIVSDIKWLEDNIRQIRALDAPAHSQDQTTVFRSHTDQILDLLRSAPGIRPQEPTSHGVPEGAAPSGAAAGSKRGRGGSLPGVPRQALKKTKVRGNAETSRAALQSPAPVVTSHERTTREVVVERRHRHKERRQTLRRPRVTVSNAGTALIVLTAERQPSDRPPTPSAVHERRAFLRDLNESIHVPPLVPPINIETLAELDATDTLRDPQLRHDMLFKDISIIPPTTNIRLSLQRSRLRRRNGHLALEDVVRTNKYWTGVMYWQAVEIEVMTGCRCAEYCVGYDGSPECGLIIRLKRMEEGCRCGGWMPEKSEQQWRDQIAKSFYPSRLEELIKQLRLIFVALMGSTVRSPGPVPYSTVEAEAAEAQRQQDAQAATDIVQRLLGALDPTRLTAQARHGLLGLELFDAIAEAMKYHCAPARDRMVDEMVRTATSGHIGIGFKRIFECAEAMKVDIVNHHLHQYRPSIIDAAPVSERTTLTAMLGERYIEQTVSRDWLHEVSKQVVMEAQPSDRSHLLARCPCASSTELIVRSVSRGFVDLVFDAWDLEVDFPVWPTEPINPDFARQGQKIPEVWCFDRVRIGRYLGIVVELYNTYMVLSAFRLIWAEHNPGKTQQELATQVEGALVDLEILQHDTSLEILIDRSAPAEWAYALARRIVLPPTDHAVDTDHAAQPILHVAIAQKIEKIARQLEAFRPNKTAKELAHKRLRSLVTLLVTNALLAKQGDELASLFPRPDTTAVRSCRALRLHCMPETVHTGDGHSTTRAATQARQAEEAARETRSKEEEQAIARAGYAGLADRLRRLVKKMEPLILVNVFSFKEFYAVKGMLFATGEPTEDEMKATLEWRKTLDRDPAAEGMMV